MNKGFSIFETYKTDMGKLKSKAGPVKVKNANKLFGEIKLQIEQARKEVAVQVNQSLTLLYWNIGNLIHHHILAGSRADYGKEIVATVSRQLTEEYGNGYNVSALWRMVQYSSGNCLPVLKLSRQCRDN